MRVNLCRFTGDNKIRSAIPSSEGLLICVRRWAFNSTKCATRFLKRSNRSRMSELKIAEANKGEPHHRPHFDAHGLATREAQHVIVEAVFFIPEFVVVDADVVHRARDVDKVLKELACEILIDRVVQSQLHGDRQHVRLEHGHPTRPVRLKRPAGR